MHKSLWFSLILLALTFSLQADSLFCSTDNECSLADSSSFISLHRGEDLELSFPGSITSFPFYSSGTGSQRGEKWIFDHADPSDFAYQLTQEPLENNPFSSFTLADLASHPITVTQFYSWHFSTDQGGIITLVFKKYPFSNATIFPLPGSSFRKQPLEEKRITISIQ